MTRPFRNYWCENFSNPTILKFEPKFPSIKICVKFLQMLIRGKLKKNFTIFKKFYNIKFQKHLTWKKIVLKESVFENNL